MVKKNSLMVAMMVLAGLGLGACAKDTTKYTLDQKVDAIVKQISAEAPDQPVNDEMKNAFTSNWRSKKQLPMPRSPRWLGQKMKT